jgi:hypothetical protein
MRVICAANAKQFDRGRAAGNGRTAAQGLRTGRSLFQKLGAMELELLHVASYQLRFEYKGG